MTKMYRVAGSHQWQHVYREAAEHGTPTSVPSTNLGEMMAYYSNT